MPTSQPDPIPILHRDARVVLVDKPAGLAAIPERDPQIVCLQRLLEGQLGCRLWVVHRLDKEVSGVMAFALDAEAHRHLCRRFESREVLKVYQALVLGRPEQVEGRIDVPIHQFGSGRMGVDPRGKPASTRWRVVSAGRGLCCLELHPETGRRHQLRVHCHHMGHPIAGDPAYGDAVRQRRFPRLFLHAVHLEFTGPDGQQVAADSAVGREWAFQAIA